MAKLVGNLTPAQVYQGIEEVYFTTFNSESSFVRGDSTTGKVGLDPIGGWAKMAKMKLSEKNHHDLTIGRLAKVVGVNVETVRYYQRIGLIDEPAMPVSGYRTYSTKTAENITFIKRAQRLGFSLKEIAELLQIGDGHCDDVRTRAEKKRNRIDEQIRDLQSLRDTLNQLICECKSGKNGSHCPIVETLLEQDIALGTSP